MMSLYLWRSSAPTLRWHDGVSLGRDRLYPFLFQFLAQ